MKKLIQNFKDYYSLNSPSLRAAAIDRALSKDLTDSRVVNRTPAENLMHFLYIYGREHTAQNIRSLVSRETFANNYVGYEDKIMAFLQAIITTSQEVFEIDLPLIQGPTLHYNHHEIVSFFKDNNYANDLEKIDEYKKLIIKVFASMGYVAPVFECIYPENITSDQFADDDFVDRFATKVVQQTGNNNTLSVITACRIPSCYKILLAPEVAPANLQRSSGEKIKDAILKLLLIVSIIVGTTESFLPYFFVFNSGASLNFSRPVLITLSGIAFVSAFLVSSLVFHTGSFAALESLFLKPYSVMFYDEKGQKLPWYGVVKNIIAILLAIIAAITLTGLSFSFYSNIFPLSIAYICVIANLIGWTGLLTTAVISVLNKKTFSEITEEIKNLIFSPIVDVYQNFSLINIVKKLLTLSVNLIVLVAIILLSMGVISATVVLFNSALSDVIHNSDLLAQYLSPQDAVYITIIAMLPLSLFLIKNVSRIINFIRTSVFDTLAKFKSLIQIKKNYAMNHETTAYRKKATRFRNRLAVVFAGCSLVNAISGSAGLYTNSAVAESIIWAANFFGIPSEYVPAMISASMFAAIANVFASIGNTIFPAVNTVRYDNAMNLRRRDFGDIYFAKQQATLELQVSPLTPEKQLSDLEPNSQTSDENTQIIVPA